jgi:hypothetical protein
MAYKKVSSLEADVTITIGGADKKTGKKNPTSVEGFYLGSRQVETKGKWSDKPSTIYFFQTDKGNVGVWGKTNLNNKMKSAKAGEMTRITYAGMKSTTNGEMHVYNVEQDPDVSIDVSELTASSESSNNESSDEDNYADAESLSDEDLDDNTDDYASAPVVTESAAARKAKVQELLRKGATKSK